MNAPRPGFVDEALAVLAKTVMELTTFANLLLRLDLSSASLNPKVDQTARAAQIRDRAASLQQLVDMRSRVLERIPRLRDWWRDEDDRVMRVAITMAEEAAKLVESGTMRQRSQAEALADALQLLPVAFGVAEETPQDVVEFCTRANLSNALFAVVVFVKEAFPGVRNLHLELTHDPEGDEEWIDVMVDVPAAESFERYCKYVERLSAAPLLPQETNKIRLLYNAVA